MAAYDSVLDLIGNTPLVDVTPLSGNPRARLLVKLEGQNPGGSVKDRAARAMIEEAEKDGRLVPGQTILESSSGNTGIALAMIARVKGYPIKIVLPENVSSERRQLLAVWGAEVIPSPASQGSNGAMREAKRLAARHPDWFFPYQYGNPANPKAHYEGTGPEIWRDCPEVTHFVAGLGTGGTLMGAGRFLKERNAAVQVWAVEPPAGEVVDGLKSLDEGFVPEVISDNDGFGLLDRKMIVRQRDSVVWTRRLTEVGVFAGISAGAVVAAAVRATEEIDEGAVVALVADAGWKYLSTGAWTDDLDDAADRTGRVLYF